MKRKEKVSIMKSIALVTQIGVSVIVTILLAMLLGRTIDGWLGTKILFTMIFTILGVATSFMTILRLGTGEKNKKLEEWGEDEDDEDHPGS